MILPLSSPDARLENVGGKGANLSALAQAGFPVPDGFLITTQAYRTFVEANNLGQKIQNRVGEIHIKDPDSLQDASEEIRAWFSSGDIPPALVTQISDAYASLNGVPAAVRSSATAEDLPELSFAGQQDTYLNVIGETSLLTAVVDCWSSLWTARAISYRARSAISNEEVALGVVVQEMVPSEASGVLFSANPLTGLRTEAVIDATLGLGESIVGGHVEPDHYVIDLKRGEILTKTLGSKGIAMHGKAGGGVRTEEIDAAQSQALPDEQILELAQLGKQIAELYDFPQDIEWAWADKRLYILQSRPITSLFPIPEGMPPDPLRVMLSFASVQGILDPITPLGQDAIRLLFAGGASLFDLDLNLDTLNIIEISGERLWVDITAGLRNPIGSRIIPKSLSAVDPSVLPAIEKLWDDPNLATGTGHLRISTLRRLVGFMFMMAKRTLPSVYSPEGRADQIHHASQREINRLQSRSKAIPDAHTTLPERIKLFREMYYGFPFAVPNIFSGAISGLAPLFLLNKISTHLTGANDLALEITRGLPNNITTQMDLDLWETAKTIRSDAIALKHMSSSTVENLSTEFINNNLPDTAQEAIANFLQVYGIRGVGEIDIGHPRWNEDPTHIMGVLQSYLQIEDETLAPDAVFQRGEKEAEGAIAELEAIARGTFGGWLKTKIIRGAARRVRALAGLRESPKFHIVGMMWVIRHALLEYGRELVDAGTQERPDDLFFLYLSELEAFAQGEQRDWKNLVSARRASYSREMSRVQIPRLLLSDGRAFYEGLTSGESDSSILKGSPVSPGVVEGLVRVVLDPQKANLVPGEILVCQGTDPAWTPLFLAAGGLVIEVGGMMTHGAIVAREYGIPAVVGVHQATTVLQTGQRIQVNGSTGEIHLQDG